MTIESTHIVSSIKQIVFYLSKLRYFFLRKHRVTSQKNYHLNFRRSSCGPLIQLHRFCYSLSYNSALFKRSCIITPFKEDLSSHAGTWTIFLHKYQIKEEHIKLPRYAFDVRLQYCPLVDARAHGSDIWHADAARSKCHDKGRCDMTRPAVIKSTSVMGWR